MSAPWVVAFGALSSAVCVIGFLVLGVLRRVTAVLEESEARLAALRTHPSGLLPGTRIPTFSAIKAGGGTFTDVDLRGATTVVLFIGSSCAACAQMVEDLRAARIPELDGRLVVATQDPADADDFTRAGATVVLQEDGMLARLFQSDRVPHAFVVDRAGRIAATGWPNTWKGVEALLAEAQGGGEHVHEVPAVLNAT